MIKLPLLLRIKLKKKTVLQIYLFRFCFHEGFVLCLIEKCKLHVSIVPPSAQVSKSLDLQLGPIKPPRLFRVRLSIKLLLNFGN